MLCSPASEELHAWAQQLVGNPWLTQSQVPSDASSLELMRLMHQPQGPDLFPTNLSLSRQRSWEHNRVCRASLLQLDACWVSGSMLLVTVAGLSTGRPHVRVLIIYLVHAWVPWLCCLCRKACNVKFKLATWHRLVRVMMPVCV